MADIELVIKIAEEKLNIIKNKMYCGIYDVDLYKAIENGTPLPKGHGDMYDCISRQAVIEYIEGSEAELGHSPENELVCQHIKELPPVTLDLTPCDDAISRQAVLDLIEHYNSDGLGSVFYGYEEGVKFANAVNKLPPVNPQPKTGQFAKWVASEIFDENWEYNWDGFAELACRKLAKLGIVRAKGDEWELIEPQERSE